VARQLIKELRDLPFGIDVKNLDDALGNLGEIFVCEMKQSTTEQEDDRSHYHIEHSDRTEGDQCLSKVMSI